MAEVAGGLVDNGPVTDLFGATRLGFGAHAALLRDASSVAGPTDAEFVCVNDAALDLIEIAP